MVDNPDIVYISRSEGSGTEQECGVVMQDQ